MGYFSSTHMSSVCQGSFSIGSEQQLEAGPAQWRLESGSECGFLLPSLPGFRGSNPGHQALMQAFLPAEPSLPLSLALSSSCHPRYLNGTACAVFLAGLARSQSRAVPQGPCGGSKSTRSTLNPTLGGQMAGNATRHLGIYERPWQGH